MSTKFLQISEVSDLLDISTTTTRRLVKSGVLPAVRVGRQIRIDQRRFQEWLDRGMGSTKRAPTVLVRVSHPGRAELRSKVHCNV